MNFLLKARLVLFILLLSSAAGAQNATTYSALDFSGKLEQDASAPLIDVRTPEEFEKGHLEKAVNYNWNGSDFDKQISQLDKSAPVYIYCLSGGRSTAAAKKMRQDGFTQVYELEGGIMKWRAANLPEVTSESASPGMTKAQFDELLKTDKTVLIDFYADWCAPCKKMKPYLDEISKEKAASVIVIRINADDNKQLCKEMKIEELPVLQVYKNHEMLWEHKGFMEKKAIVKELEQ